MTWTEPFAGTVAVSDASVSRVPLALSRCQEMESPTGKPLIEPISETGKVVVEAGERLKVSAGVDEEPDEAEGPTHEPLDGVTVKVYPVPAVRPLTAQLLPVVLQPEPPPVTAYWVPLGFDGSVHDTVASLESNGAAVTPLTACREAALIVIVASLVAAVQ